MSHKQMNQTVRWLKIARAYLKQPFDEMTHLANMHLVNLL